MHKNLSTRLQALFDLLCGNISPYQPLPEAYFQQTDWTLATQTLQVPAAWRRQAKVR